jgi:glycosyltransferase involved in cell wall biosynthesis
VRRAVSGRVGVAARAEAGSSPGGGKPRIVIVAHGAHDEGGMERVFAELIRRAHRNCDLVVISSELAPDLLPLVRWERTRVPRRPAPLRFCLFYVLAGLRVRRARRRADLVHTCGALVPNRADLASVHFCHAGFRAAEESDPDDKPMLRRLNTAVANGLALAAEHWSYRRGRTRVLGAVSEGVAKELERAYPGARIVVTPNGVDLARFRPDAVVRAEIRDSRRVDDGDLVALFVGGDWYRKGLGIVLDALPESPGTRLWIVGHGDEAAFRARAEELGVADRTEFLGARPDVERYYQAADVFVLPSRYEAFPLVSLEAAACGLPLVVTHVNGVDELIGSGEAGRTVERSGEAVAAALRELSSDPECRRAMGRAARERASAFTWDASAESVLDVYGELCPSVHEAEEVAA